MSDIPVHWLERIPPAPAAVRADASLPRTAQGVSVEIAGPAKLADVQTAWDELLARADAPNVFMHPALLRAAAEADPAADYRALLAWKFVGGRHQLVGLWAFAVGLASHSPLPMRVLTAPRERHGHLATPVIDRDCLDETLDSMLDAIAADPKLPKLVALDMMGTGGATYAALIRVLTRRGSASCLFAQGSRPKLASDLDGKAYLERAFSSSTRKKLRQHRRRLAEKGELTSVIASEPETVRKALEQFLALEASGWKGRQGTALLCNETDAGFMRGAVGALAGHGCAAIHSLYLDGKPVSMQIVARAGAAAFTWKTAYDEAFHDVSPGALLLEDYTTAFLADKSIAFVDSCSFDDSGFMSAWGERIGVADLWLDARRGGSISFRCASRMQKAYLGARGAAKRAYHAYHSWQKARKR